MVRGRESKERNDALEFNDNQKIHPKKTMPGAKRRFTSSTGVLSINNLPIARATRLNFPAVGLLSGEK